MDNDTYLELYLEHFPHHKKMSSMDSVFLDYRFLEHLDVEEAILLGYLIHNALTHSNENMSQYMISLQKIQEDTFESVEDVRETFSCLYNLEFIDYAVCGKEKNIFRYELFFSKIYAFLGLENSILSLTTQERLLTLWNKKFPDKSVPLDSPEGLLCLSLLSQLLSGVFFRSHKWDVSFAGRFKLPITSSYVWSEDSIKKGFDQLGNLYLEGFWPPDKSTLPKKLSTLLYNKRTKKSLFVSQFHIGIFK